MSLSSQPSSIYPLGEVCDKLDNIDVIVAEQEHLGKLIETLDEVILRQISLNRQSLLTNLLFPSSPDPTCVFCLKNFGWLAKPGEAEPDNGGCVRV